MYSLRLRIFALVFGLTLLIQCASLFTLYQKVHTEAERNLSERLESGQQVFANQFDTRRRSLAIYAQTLAKDFGLLEAFHEGRKNLLVALEKRRKQVGASVAVAVDLKGIIRADTGRPGLIGQPFELAADAMPYATSHALFLDIDGTTYQTVAAPLNAPNRVGWVLLGYKLDDTLAQQLQSFISLQVSFLQQDTDDRWQLIATTLPITAATGFREYLGLPRHDLPTAVQTLGDESYRGITVELGAAPGKRVVALLQRSENTAIAYYRLWWSQIVEVFAAALLLALLGAWLLARSVTKPVRLLVDQASAIETGNYAEPITIRQHGELGTLVDKFNRMQQAIADREASIRRHAEHDAVTGLANRTRFEQLIEESIRNIGATDRRLAVMSVSLDRFKDINDTLGYDAGDRLLREVGERLRGIVGDQNVVARIGGDEFGVLLRGTTLKDMQAQLARITAAFSGSYAADGLTLHLSAAIGLASCPDHGRDAATLLRHADMARWSAKQKHLRYAIYDGTQDRFSRLRLSLLGELQNAIRDGDLVLHYQPKLELARAAVVGVEALVRWKHPIYGLIPPGDFIPMLEHTGNITLVTDWAMRTACKQATSWYQSGMRLRIAVNMSAYDLRNPEFVEDVERLVKTGDTDPSMLALEITESAVMEDVGQAVTAFRRFRDMGLTLSIDDYGTGYSSMAQLKRLPLDELKIDRSFVTGVDRSEDDEIIVRSTIELGHNMGLKVVGEGVESKSGLEVLRKLHCDSVQGYFISRSLAADKFESWWQSGIWRAAIARH
jgi:diguanylate cyclase (GGDEF)-like protein